MTCWRDRVVAKVREKVLNMPQKHTGEGPEILDNFAAKRMKSESVPPKRNSSDTVRRQRAG